MQILKWLNEQHLNICIYMPRLDTKTSKILVDQILACHDFRPKKKEENYPLCQRGKRNYVNAFMFDLLEDFGTHNSGSG